MTKHEYSQLLMQLLTPTLPFYSPQKPDSAQAALPQYTTWQQPEPKALPDHSGAWSPSGPEEAAVLNLSSCICQALPQAPILKTRNIGAAFRILTSALWKWLPSPTAY